MAPPTREGSMSGTTKIRVLCVDDHPLMREGITAIVQGQPDMEVVASARDGSEAVRVHREERPDLTLMDVRLPDMSGIDALIAIRQEFPDARIVMLSTFEGDVEVQRALQAGAYGYLVKSMPPDELVAAVRSVHRGRKHIPPRVASNLAEHLGEENLTPRELEVLREVAGGHRNREIGERLHITEETVKVHVKHIMEKLGARDRTEAVAIALRRGFIHY
jgi:DNA-binding NarL/FixJ family response regulator